MARTCWVLVALALLTTGIGAGPALVARLAASDARVAANTSRDPDRRPQGVAPDVAITTATSQTVADTRQGRPASPGYAGDAGNGLARVVPYVEAIEPSSDRAPIDTLIVVRFSQPMKHASVEQSFSIRPRMNGKFEWLDDFTMRFRPAHLAHGQLYEVAVGGRSSRGVPLAPKASGQFTTVAGPPIVLLPGPTAIRVPILMYHYIRVNPDTRDQLGFALSVTPTDFAAQMDWLARNGYHPITLQDLNRYFNGEGGLPSRPVILTFDDGYADFYTTALPILRAHDFSAVAYIVSGFIGWPGYMTAEQVIEADRVGIEIGSHSVNHVNLAKQSANALQYELKASKEDLEHLLGHSIDALCYPSGRFSQQVIEAAQAAGYRDATTTNYGSGRTLADRYTWGRLRVQGGESLDQFASAVLGAS